MTPDQDAFVDAAFGAAERAIEPGEFSAKVALRLRRRARLRRIILAGGALIGAAIAAPQLSGFVQVVNHRLESISPIANIAGWLVVALVAAVALEAVLRPEGAPSLTSRPRRSIS